MKKDSYNIGLDIGTASVGWAVTDVDGNLLKFNKKNMWGVRLFNEGETAETRRSFRSTRRRLDRRKKRVLLLQDLISDDVLNVDEAFFIRLKESFLFKEDRSMKNQSALFNDKKFKDGDYHREYPTIYHLRKELMNSNNKKDIRLVYLALHHIVKYRGNFLYDNLDLKDSIAEIQNEILSIFEFFDENLGYGFNNDEESIMKVIEVLKDKNTSKKEKETRLRSILSPDQESKTPINNFIKSILGYKADFSSIFSIEMEGTSLNFDLSKEYNETEVEVLLGDRLEEFISIKKIYNWHVLQDILKGNTYISDSMIGKYEKHKKDLEILKSLIKEHYSDEYYNIFRDDTKGMSNYTNYIEGEKCEKEKLYTFLTKILKTKENTLKDNESYNYCISTIKDDDFLNKLRTVENAAIPYQLNMLELELIIDNQSKYYASLKQNKDKIIKLLKFRIPYYVGPLNPYKEEFAWMKRKSGTEGMEIYPWNFDDIVDTDLSAEKFIDKMRNKCTYLPEKDVIPKHSLLYSEYMVLNELNKIRKNDDLLDIREKNQIIEELFKVKRNVKEKDLINWFKMNPPHCTELINNSIKIEGYQKDKEFASSLGSYIDFKEIFSEVNESNYEKIEEIIKWITLFEDKKILERKITQNYPEVSKKQLDKIMRLKYSGWSRLSKELIDGISIYENGYRITIIKKLRESTMNFMQIINDNKLGFNKKIAQQTLLKNVDRISYKDDILELQGSPALKRGIWQTVRILEEIINVMGKEPENIFMEFARNEDDKKRTRSRMNRLSNIYDSMINDINIYNKEIHDELKNKKDQKNLLNSRALYLYFTQNGKCMYTGKPLDIDKLHLYEIDHIIPQSYIKDDSIENTVLVCKIDNQEKSANMLINADIRNSQQYMWGRLHKYGLIGTKKYNNLQRSFFKDNELKGFINRQLVETRQISKHLAKMFTERYEETNVMAIRAELTSNFRQQFELYKIRNLNDYHHAHDAYLASVIGTFVVKRFPKYEGEFKYDDYINKYKSNNKSSVKDKSGLLISSISKDYENGDFNWKISEEIFKIKKVLNYKDCNITKKLEEQTGEFYNQTIYPSKMNKSNSLAKIPLKKGLDIEKYGGYSGENNSYLVAIEYKKGKKRSKNFIGIPIYTSKLIKDEKDLISYIENDLEYQDVKIINSKIKSYQLIYEAGHPIYIFSDTEKHNAKQLWVDQRYHELLYKIGRDKEKRKDEEIDKELLDEFYSYMIDKIRNEYPIYINIAETLEKIKNEFLELEKLQKADFINQILNITKANASKGNFSEFKLSYNTKEAGRTRSYKMNEIEMVNQSITGLFEKRCKL